MLDMKGVTERLVKYKILVVVGGPVGPGTKIILTYFTNKQQGKKNLSFSLQGENDTPKNNSISIGREFY